MPGRLRCRASMPGRRGRHQAAEPSQAPGSLLYVLYVLYGSYKASRRTLTVPRVLAIRPICAIWLYKASRRTLTVSGLLAIRPICAIWLLQGKPPNPHSLRAPCYTSYMCYMALTRQAVELYTIHIASQHVPKMHCIAHIVYFNARLDNI